MVLAGNLNIKELKKTVMDNRKMNEGSRLVVINWRGKQENEELLSFMMKTNKTFESVYILTPEFLVHYYNRNDFVSIWNALLY